MIAVSIIIPIYNVEKYLTRCLESLIYQEFDEDYEIICVNDGSTDGSEKILKYFAKQCDKIKIITQEHKGPSTARNEGMKIAQGKYTLFVDSDDFIAANALQLLYEYAQKHNSDVVIFDMHVGNSNLEIHNTTKWQNIIDKYGENSFNIQTAEPFVYRFVPVAVWNKFYLTDLIKDIKFVNGITCEDVPYWTNVYSKAQRVNYLPLALYFYITDRPDAITKSTDDRVFDVFKAFECTKQVLVNSGYYEKLKYIHWVHFASNIAVYINNIDNDIRAEFIDIDFDEINNQDFFPFEKKNIELLKSIVMPLKR